MGWILLFYFSPAGASVHTYDYNVYLTMHIDTANNMQGKVVDSSGAPIPGATIIVTGTKNGTTTNALGQFILKNVANHTRLEVRCMGFVNKAVLAEPYLLVTLDKSTNNLDEAVVLAYGRTSKRFNTGNISSISSHDIETQPVNNPLLALQGRVPGIYIQPSSGVPGDGMKVRIQGQNSIIKGSDPFYVVDGVPFIGSNFVAFGGILGDNWNPTTTAPPPSPLAFINPEDIARIEVLKDADATSIYGSRAANGAILITTKSAAAGRTAVDLRAQVGTGHVTGRVPVLSTPDYLQMRRTAYENAPGTVPDMILAPDLLLWDSTANTNWQNVLMGNQATITDIAGSVSGGKDLTRFLLSGTYRKETTVFPGDFNNTMGALHFSITQTSSNSKFRLVFSGNEVYNYSKLPTTNLVGPALTIAPNAPPLYTQSGDINWAPDPNGNSTWINPFNNPAALLLQYTRSNTINLMNNLQVGYEIVKNLKITSSLGFTYLTGDQFGYFPFKSNTPELQKSAGQYARQAQYGNNYMKSWIWEPQASYLFNHGKSRMEALVGGSIQRSNTQTSGMQGYGYVNDQVMENPLAASTLTYGPFLKYLYKYAALFGRLNWNYNETYVLTLTARRDASSRFGPGNQMHNFASAAGAWIFSENTFIKRNIGFLSFGKLKLSYGTTGNDQIGDYQYIALYTPSYVSPIPYQGISTYQISGLANKDLQWESTKKLNTGITLGVFKDHLLLDVNYYRNESSNQLLFSQQPSFSGYGGIAMNLPATVRNSGFEFLLTGNNVKLGKVNWTSSLNATIPKNELVRFANFSNSGYQGTYIIGKPITSQKLYTYAGVDPATGIYQFYDKQHKIVSDPDTMNAYYNTVPTFTAGWSNTFSYKGFSIDMFWMYVKQQGPKGSLFGYFGYGPFNMSARYKDYWKKPGDDATWQKPLANFDGFDGFGNLSNSTGGIESASFLRLKNIAITYQFQKPVLQRLHLSNLSVFVYGQNLLTFSPYSGSDPEVNNNGALPLLRTVTFGVKVGL
ncbi:SusC/RagA family TonB-linked outer membrane protein [Chitinophaga sp. Cy-1792]|uniref:SusC/RagA family TonB-linked outer membrane protein n=1 Tax=Chitinophaga sp. Cy-1792 TaxID=2608339 RepID=UPI00141F6B32|nr:SusC/RagA family TonB-linked outer membrane protein [Chitinophaga sp. Cy-1792]